MARVPSLALPFVASLGACTSGACTSADGTLHGGEARYDAAPPLPLVVPITEPSFSDAPRTSWRGLYRDFFGRGSPATCAGNGACHDAADKPGARSSGFVCADVDGCYQSLRTAKDPLGKRALVEDADLAAPAGAHLFEVIRYRTASGQLLTNRGMPELPATFAYSPDDVTRMQAWIQAGAKND
jgi:hypothetical protein